MADALSTVRAALTVASRTCRHHGNNPENPGMSRCETCKQIYRVGSALASLNEIQADRQMLIDALADCVTKAVEYGEQEGGFVAFYLLPTGPIHRAMTLLQERNGVTVRPGFDGREAQQ